MKTLSEDTGTVLLSYPFILSAAGTAPGSSEQRAWGRHGDGSFVLGSFR